MSLRNIFINKRNKPKIIFIVTGRLGITLTISKALPVLALKYFDEIFIFRESEGPTLPGIRYITNEKLKIIKPRVLQKILRHFIEPIQLIMYAVFYKPLIINGYHLIPSGINSFISGKIAGCKIVLSLIGGVPEVETYHKIKFFWKKLNLFILRYCNLVTTKGKYISDYLTKNGINSDKIITYNGAIDCEKFKVNKNVIRDIDILFVGSFTELKGPDRVLEIIENIIEQKISVKAYFLGDGPLEKYIRNKVVDSEIKQYVTFKGYTHNTENYFQRSKLLIMPSRSEGLSTAMLEAMACGCVPIVSNVGSMSEAALNGINSILVDDFMDIDAFTDAVKMLLLDNQKREKLALNGIDLIKKRYTKEAQSIIFGKIIEKLI